MALKKSFKKYGDQVSFVSLSGSVAIFRRDKPNPEVERPTHFEVIKPIEIGGELTYPGASMWGIYAWTCIGEKELVQQMAKLEKKEQDWPELTEEIFS
jgi:hypothetical protein